MPVLPLSKKREGRRGMVALLAHIYIKVRSSSDSVAYGFLDVLYI